MSKRLQVVMTEAEYAEVQGAADGRRMTVSEWVRLALRAARELGPHVGSGLVREVGPGYGDHTPALPRRVRVEVDVREDLLDAVRRRYHLPSWRAAVEHALRRAAVRPMSKEEALAMQGAGWEGDLDEMRTGDPGDAW